MNQLSKYRNWMIDTYGSLRRCRIFSGSGRVISDGYGKDDEHAALSALGRLRR